MLCDKLGSGRGKRSEHSVCDVQYVATDDIDLGM